MSTHNWKREIGKKDDGKTYEVNYYVCEETGEKVFRATWDKDSKTVCIPLLDSYNENIPFYGGYDNYGEVCDEADDFLKDEPNGYVVYIYGRDPELYTYVRQANFGDVNIVVEK